MNLGEKRIQNDSLRWLATQRDLRVIRLNTGVGFYGSGANRRAVRYGVPGMTDTIVLLPHGRVAWLEFKSPTGRQSPQQKSFQAMVELLDHIYILARSVDDVRNGIRRVVG